MVGARTHQLIDIQLQLWAQTVDLAGQQEVGRTVAFEVQHVQLGRCVGERLHCVVNRLVYPAFLVRGGDLKWRRPSQHAFAHGFGQSSGKRCKSWQAFAARDHHIN